MEVKAEAHHPLVQQLLSAGPTQVVFLPVYGEGDTNALCYVLRIEGITILLDCGWDETFSLDVVEPLAAIAPHVDVVLLSHAHIAHTGALPYACAQLGLAAEVYATIPVQHMGQMNLYDAFCSLEDGADFDTFSLDEVDAAFDAVRPVRFSQQTVLGGPAREAGAGGARPHVRVTALPAGHSLGGAVWHISVHNQDFVYAVSMNLRDDSHLAACRLQALFHRPALLITDATCAGRPEPGAQMAATFCSTVVNALKRPNGNVLIPVDTSTRVLELLLLLERHWAKHNLHFPIVFLSHTALPVLEKAATQLEFVSERVQQDFARGRSGNPFALPHVHKCYALDHLKSLPQARNLVVLASGADLETGFARRLLLAWGPSADNTVVFPLPAAAGTLAARLQGGGRGVPMTLRQGVRVPLSEEELLEREAAEARARAERAEAEADTAPMDAEDTGEGGGGVKAEPEDDDFGAARANTASIAQQHAGGGQSHAVAHDDGRHDSAAFRGVLIDGFCVPADAAAPMFPFAEEGEGQEWDDFGAVTDLVALCGRHYYGDEDADDGGDGGAAAAAPDVFAIVERPPSKVVYEEVTLTVRAAIVPFDFSGLIGQSTFLSMVRAVAPRNLILVRRPPQTELLLPKLQDTLRGLYSHVHTPVATESITLPATACYIAQLTPELNAALEAAKPRVRGAYMLGWMDAVVCGRDRHTGHPLLALPEDDQADLHTPAAVFLGDAMVSDITRTLKEKQLKVLQQGESASVEDDTVIIRQDTASSLNELIIEGALSETYYRVRDIIYDKYRLVANG